MTTTLAMPEKNNPNAVKMPSGQRLRVVFIILISRADEGRFEGLKLPAIGIDADDDWRGAGFHRGRFEFDEHGIFQKFLRGDDEAALPHHAQVAARIFQAQFHGRLARGLVDDANGVKIAEPAVGHLLKERAGGAQNGGLDFRTRENHHDQQRRERGQHDEITGEARREAERFAAFDAIERGVADEAARRADFGHHVVAGIHAGGAVDALHLRAVADVNAGRADGNAVVAGDAIAVAGLPAFGEHLGALDRGAFFAARVIVGDDDGILIQQKGLQAAIRTNEGASLFAKPGKDSVKQNCESDHESQAGDVLRRRVGDDLAELLPADDIAQQNVADEERERKKNAVLGNLLENFPSGPRRTVQLALRWRVAFYEEIGRASYRERV